MSRWDEWLAEINKAKTMGPGSGDTGSATPSKAAAVAPRGVASLAPSRTPVARTMGPSPTKTMGTGHKVTPLGPARVPTPRAMGPGSGARANPIKPEPESALPEPKSDGAKPQRIGSPAGKPMLPVAQVQERTPDSPGSMRIRPAAPITPPGSPGKPEVPEAPKAPETPDKGEDKDKIAKIKGVRYPNPRGPSPMDWFHYGQAQGQMTTQAGSAPGILAAHTARVLGRAQQATGARRSSGMESAQQRQLMLTRQAGAGGGVVTQQNKSLETIKSHTLPSIYLHSKLFPRGRLAERDKAIKLPDPAEENLQPEQDELPEEIKSWAHKAIHRIIESAGGIEKARRLLMAMAKAGAAQESSGRHTFPSEDQAKREEESPRSHRGVGNAGTPDLPERGADWHGTVPGVPDVPEDSEDVDTGKTGDEQGQDRPNPKKKQEQPTPGHPANPPLQPSKTEEAIKALAGAPRFSPGPFTPPREAKFLLEFGYSPEEIKSGDYRVAPWMRAEFNRQQTSVINKSIDGLLGRISR